MADFDSVVFLSPFPWDGLWQTSHYIANHLARHVPLLNVELAPEWNPRSVNFRADQALRVLKGRCFRREGDIHVLTPRTLPAGRWASVSKWNEKTYRKDVHAACRRLGFRKPLYWVFYYEGCLRKLASLQPDTYIYHCLDHFERGDAGEERKLAAGAAMVLAVSQPLVDKHKAANEATFLLTNGVNLEWFDVERQEETPSDLPKGSLLIGFDGNLNRLVDIDLILQAAIAYPNEQFILIGPTLRGGSSPGGAHQQALARLHTLANVRLLGLRSPWELGRYLKAFDICIIPFQQNEMMWYADPLKFYQYLALGKPIVAVSLPAFEPYKDLCYVAASREQFLPLIQRALDEGRNQEMFRRRVAAGRQHSWDLIGQRAWELVQNQLQTRL